MYTLDCGSQSCLDIDAHRERFVKIHVPEFQSGPVVSECPGEEPGNLYLKKNIPGNYDNQSDLGIPFSILILLTLKTHSSPKNLRQPGVKDPGQKKHSSSKTEAKITDRVSSLLVLCSETPFPFTLQLWFLININVWTIYDSFTRCLRAKKTL